MSNDKKAICTVVNEAKELLKYEPNKKNIVQVIEMLENIQRSAFQMEKGLSKSRYDVGEAILMIDTSNISLQEYITQINNIILSRWPTLISKVKH